VAPVTTPIVVAIVYLVVMLPVRSVHLRDLLIGT